MLRQVWNLATGIVGRPLSHFVKIQAIDRRCGFRREGGENCFYTNGDCGVMDKEDQYRKARDGQQDANGNGQVRHEAGALDALHSAKHQEAVDESADEGAQYQLITAIAHEVAQDPRPEL